MPRYFFDIEDGHHHSIDDTGVICTNDEEVRAAAIAALPEIAKEEMADGNDRTIWVNVRDEQGKSVFTASLELKSGWLRVHQ